MPLIHKGISPVMPLHNIGNPKAAGLSWAFFLSECLLKCSNCFHRLGIIITLPGCFMQLTKMNLNLPIIMNYIRQKLLLTLVLISCILLSASAGEQEKKDTLRVLFVGNSYTYVENLPQLVSLLSEGTKTKLVTRKSTVGGAYLSEHWKSERGLKTRELISKGKFDMVVLQDNSMATIQQPDSTAKYARLLCQLIRQSGAKPFLYMTWARERVPQYQQEISFIYSKIAKDNNATLVPVGQAWELARQLRPAISLFNPDGSHPSALGAILSAYVFTCVLTGEVPSSIPGEFWIKDADGESVQLNGIDNLDAVFFQKVTEQILKDKNNLPTEPITRTNKENKNIHQ